MHFPNCRDVKKEVLAYLSQGLSTSEISQLLFLSINTIQTYRKRLMEKLEAKKRCRTCLQGEELILRTLVIRPDSYKPPASSSFAFGKGGKST